MISDEEGKRIASIIGVRYKGILEGAGAIPPMYAFKDTAQTGTTFLARTLEEAKDRLAETRQRFLGFSSGNGKASKHRTTKSK